MCHLAEVVWIEKVCQNEHTLYQKLLIVNNFSTEWWNLCDKIDNFHVCFWDTNDTPIQFI